ncbi:hypothetical protein [Pedobacter puniceum]|uniref:VCBS repeat-containing protein n=1 Tax=Pedobacter puniceum TaxID=2666136 RepID=A0A7K0FR11_9SPHI|nr:hypothetical protein [Pedobacter puniceum]MRX47915.1 hypothetical protein [Pedobacter puniceum]
MKRIALIALVLATIQAVAQEKSAVPYWNSKTQLIPWRFEPQITNITYEDLDKDGDPDVLKAMLNGKIPVIWIDDNDNMKVGDKEGDTVDDCLLIDKNIDGIFAGPLDFSIDWTDENNDGKADIQLIVNNGSAKKRNFFDWQADFMYIMDDDKDQIMHYVDWNKIAMEAWEHIGHANFFYDYHGNSTFLKMHGSSFRIDDLRYNWENPFIFYDFDKDGLSEMAIRLLDIPVFRDSSEAKNIANGFDKLDKEIDAKYSRMITYAAPTWDLDNDNAPGNEFDFDMSLLLKGKGFSYTDQAHTFKKLKGIPEANKYFFDKRWREIDTLFYPDRYVAYDMIFKKGDWQEARLVFDEDDDCNRWERVEFYDPLDLFKTGGGKGGLDNNLQADVIGDRGEFDMDNSGKGNLYIAAFDGRIHLHGAEWGAWRIDQNAFSFQGFGGIYDRWRPGRMQKNIDVFATVKYTDADNNGFIDVIEYDLDGDQKFEDKVSLKALGIDDKQAVINSAELNHKGLQKLFNQVANNIWNKALAALEVAKKHNLNTDWYAFYKKPNSVNEKYQYGYWLGFYIYQDLRHAAKAANNTTLVSQLDKAYYSGNWALLNK